MNLTININQLLNEKAVVEWEQLDYKGGWKPEYILVSPIYFQNVIGWR